jgi:hypothetical protein
MQSAEPQPGVVRPPGPHDKRWIRKGGNSGVWSTPTVKIDANNADTFITNNIVYQQVPGLRTDLLATLEWSVIHTQGWEKIKGEGQNKVIAAHISNTDMSNTQPSHCERTLPCSAWLLRAAGEWKHPCGPGDPRGTASKGITQGPMC